MAPNPAADLDAAFARAAAGERVLVERPDGRRVAVVPAEDSAQLAELEDAADVAAAEKSLAEDEVLPWSEIRETYVRV